MFPIAARSITLTKTGKYDDWRGSIPFHYPYKGSGLNVSNSIVDFTDTPLSTIFECYPQVTHLKYRCKSKSFDQQDLEYLQLWHELKVLKLISHMYPRDSSLDVTNLQLTSMKNLTLYRFDITSLGENFCGHMSLLERLDVSGNELTVILPCAFDQCTRLIELDVSGTRLTYILNVC